jgi:hypothetical protein
MTINRITKQLVLANIVPDPEQGELLVDGKNYVVLVSTEMAYW